MRSQSGLKTASQSLVEGGTNLGQKKNARHPINPRVKQAAFPIQYYT